MLAIDPDSQFSKLLQAADLQNKQNAQNALTLMEQQNAEDLLTKETASNNPPANENVHSIDVTTQLSNEDEKEDTQF